MAPIPRPAAGEYDPYYDRYIAALGDGDLMQALEQQVPRMITRLGQLDDTRAMYRYAEGKWSVKEVVNHISDAERIFAYRMLRVAREDPTPMAPFDENHYAVTARSDDRTLESLLQEMRAVREATLALVRSLPAGAWERRGTASGKVISARALAAIIGGHFEHHLAILGDRYGV